MTKFIKVHCVEENDLVPSLINMDFIESLEPSEKGSFLYVNASGKNPRGGYEVSETVDEIWSMLKEK